MLRKAIPSIENLGEFTPSKTLKLYMREWRNWQTRTFEGRVVHTVRVQVPFLAPKRTPSGVLFSCEE